MNTYVYIALHICCHTNSVFLRNNTFTLSLYIYTYNFTVKWNVYESGNHNGGKGILFIHSSRPGFSYWLEEKNH